MKFNLKNRPSLMNPDSRGDLDWIGAFETWFEGFEKEFSKMLDQHAWTTEMVRDIGQKKGTLWIEVKTLKKEILGEEP